jgi:branched-chain amino acid transport system substrate-binding protein
MQIQTRGAHRCARWIGTALALCLTTSATWAQIRVGQPSGFSGAVAAGVKENTEGAALYLDAVNAKGGIHGPKGGTGVHG